MFRATRVPVVALIVNLKDGVSVNEFVKLFAGVELGFISTVLDHVAKNSKYTNLGYRDR